MKLIILDVVEIALNNESNPKHLFMDTRQLLVTVAWIYSEFSYMNFYYVVFGLVMRKWVVFRAGLADLVFEGSRFLSHVLRYNYGITEKWSSN
jgi:hypothetical protein